MEHLLHTLLSGASSGGSLHKSGGKKPVVCDGDNAIHSVVSANKPRLDIAVVAVVVAQNRSLLDVKNAKGHTPLWNAVRARNVDAAKLLLDQGADPMITSRKGRTLLHLAAVTDSANLMTLVIEAIKASTGLPYGTIVSTVHPKNGWTPLHYAAGADASAAVLVLLRYGGVAHVPSTKHGMTPLQVACKCNSLGVVLVLLGAGADPLRTKDDGWNAIHLATTNDNRMALKLCLACCANGKREAALASATNGGSTIETMAPAKAPRCVPKIRRFRSVQAAPAVAVAPAPAPTPVTTTPPPPTTGVLAPLM